MSHVLTPSCPTRRSSDLAGWEELDDGVIVAAQPHGAPTWFPCNDRPDDKATYVITIATAVGYYVASNGNLVRRRRKARSDEHTSELQSLMLTSYAVLCLKKKNIKIDKEKHTGVNT